ncbi:MAG: peptidylprolyl isomerase [Planctomycetota bacterium]|nr:MAG: peptidylprolyl isomerase [Planctomycetota bacterium]
MDTTDTTRSAGVALALALALGCQSAANRPPPDTRPARRATALAPATGAEAGAAQDAGETPVPRAAPKVSGTDVVAMVADQPVLASELLGAWLFRESPSVRTYLEEVILSRLVAAEARRFEIELDPQLVSEALRETFAQMKVEVQENGAGLTLDQFIERRLGLDPETYRARVRAEKLVDLLAERCVRAWLLENERAEVRVIVLDTADAVDEVRRRLAAGEDFAELARELSIEDSGVDGGRMPPVVRSNVALARLAFATPVGEVGGPIVEQDRTLFLKVDARPAALEGTWAEIGQAVEASLEVTSIEDPEYWQWKDAMLDRYEVDMSPFFGLVGEPLR